MKLSEHFTREELIASGTGLPNVPTEQQSEKLLYLAIYLLEPLRRRFGRIKVNSGYRSPAVNDAVEGSKTSQHMEGEAADIVPLISDIDIVFSWAEKNLKYGQIIIEHKDARWIHISLPRIGGMNQQALLYKDGRYSNYSRG